MISWIIALVAIVIVYLARTAGERNSQWASLARINAFMWGVGLSEDAKDLVYLKILASVTVCSIAALALTQYIRGELRVQKRD